MSLIHPDVLSVEHDPHLRPPAVVRRRGLEPLIVLVLVGIVCAAHGVNAAGWPAYFDDEGTYLSQALAVRDGSLAPYTYWYDHPPLGWIQLALLTWLPALFTDTQVVAGRFAMVFFSAASTALVFGVARRLGFRLPFAVLATLLWGLSPLVLFESRQVFLDTIGTPWVLLGMFLALNPQRHLGRYMAAGAAMGVAVLTKETLVVFVPAVLFTVWTRSDRRLRVFGLTAFTTAFVVVGSGYLLFAVLKGELLPGEGHVALLDALVFQTLSRRGSGFILDPGSGSHGLLALWVGMDPVLLIGGVACLVPALLLRRLRPIGCAVLVPTLLALRPNGYLPYMYVTAVLPFCGLALAGLGDTGWRRIERFFVHARHRLGELPAPSFLGSGLAAVVPVAVLALVLPTWIPHYRVAWTADVNTSHAPAVRWITAHADPDDRIVVDNNYWLDLKAAGWDDPWHDIWFTKLDLDPIAAGQHLPGGWRDVDYVIWSGAFDYLGDNDMPMVEAVHEHSVTVAVFGDPNTSDYVEIRRVENDDATAPEGSAS